MQGAGTSVLIDPALGPRISGVIPRNAGPGLAVDALPRIDASLVTHNHYDHLDLPTLRAVGAPVVAGLGTPAEPARPAVHRAGLVGPPARGRPRRSPSSRASTGAAAGWRTSTEALWGGFVVEGGGARVYHAGDTAYFGGFEEIGRRFPGSTPRCCPSAPTTRSGSCGRST